jgi:hypothetical protein
MSRPDDDVDEMINDPAVAEFLDELRSLAVVAGPAPLPDLDAMLAGTVPVPRAPRPRVRVPLRRHPVLTSLATAAAVIALLVAGAATHNLPAYAQRFVSKIVNTVTPFHIEPVPDHPKPSEGPPPGHPTRPHATPPVRSGSSTSPSPSTGSPSSPGSGSATNTGTNSGSPTRSSTRSSSPPVSSSTAPPPSKSLSKLPSPSETASDSSDAEGVPPPAKTNNAGGNGVGRGHTGHPLAPGQLKKTQLPEPGEKVKDKDKDNAKGKAKGHRAGSVDEGLQKRISEPPLGIVPRGQLGKLAHARVPGAHVARWHREHLPPVRTGVEGR